MAGLGISNQTLEDFIYSPFHKIDTELRRSKYEDRYQKYKRQNKIKIESTIEIDSNYFYHIRVPSESNEDVLYDVVIQFFTTNEKVMKSLTLDRYYVQFFSNSPGFLYKYATLYKIEGYLIESLYDKFEEGTLDTLPDKANSSYDLYYDSTIYYACRYLIDHKIQVLTKLAFRLYRKKNEEQFFSDIQSMDEVAVSNDIGKLRREIRREINSDTQLSASQERRLGGANKLLRRQISDTHRRNSSNSTIKGKSEGVKKIVAKVSTMGAPKSKRVVSKHKVSAKKSTSHKK